MISTHVLDTSRGLPAAKIPVTLEKKSGENPSAWSVVDASETNTDGRIAFKAPAIGGTYRLHFEVASYFSELNTDCFFPSATVVFNIQDTSRKYHVPLLLNPFGYSTYRGS